MSTSTSSAFPIAVELNTTGDGIPTSFNVSTNGTFVEPVTETGSATSAPLASQLSGTDWGGNDTFFAGGPAGMQAQGQDSLNASECAALSLRPLSIAEVPPLQLGAAQGTMAIALLVVILATAGLTWQRWSACQHPTLWSPVPWEHSGGSDIHCQLHRNWVNRAVLYGILFDAVMCTSPAFQPDVPWLTYLPLKAAVRAVSFSGVNADVVWATAYIIAVVTLVYLAVGSLRSYRTWWHDHRDAIAAHLEAIGRGDASRDRVSRQASGKVAPDVPPSTDTAAIVPSRVNTEQNTCVRVLSVIKLPVS